MRSADGANYQCFICKCTEKQLKKVPFGTLSTLTICYSLFCQSATPEVLALSCPFVFLIFDNGRLQISRDESGCSFKAQTVTDDTCDRCFHRLLCK